VPKSRFTDDQIAEALDKCGGIQAAAANALEQASGIECSRRIVNNRVLKSKRLRQVITDAEERTLDIAESKLIENIQAGETNAIRFYLETKGKHRGYCRRVESTGRAGAPLNAGVPHVVILPDNGRGAEPAWNRGLEGGRLPGPRISPFAGGAAGA
jgi:hypothetical protein